MLESEFSKTYVRPDDTAVLTCPHCGHQKVVLAEAFRGHRHKLRVKCLCSKPFNVFLEFRKRHRKQTLLRGTFINNSRESGTVNNLTIRDLSVIGLTLTTINADNIKLKDELNVAFHLDDEHRTEIRRDVIVRTIRPGGAFGCEMQISYNGYSGGPLGYYIMK